MTEETYEEYKARRERENKALMTDPPTNKLGKTLEESVIGPDYPDCTEVKWVCPCGNDRLEVYYEEGAYRTFVKCPSCGLTDDVHTG